MNDFKGCLIAIVLAIFIACVVLNGLFPCEDCGRCRFFGNHHHYGRNVFY